MTASSDMVLDTSVWITAFRGNEPEILERARNLIAADRVVTCGPILFEIGRGIRRSERRSILPLLGAVRAIPFDESDWSAAGEIDAELRGRGVTIPPMDVLIARACIREGLPLWTLDRHFEEIPGLDLIGLP